MDTEVKKLCRNERRESHLGNHELQPRKQGRLYRLCLSSEARNKQLLIDLIKRTKERTPHDIIIWKCILPAHLVVEILIKQGDFFYTDPENLSQSSL